MEAAPLETGVGVLSPKLRGIVEALQLNLRAVTERALAAMRVGISDYRHINDPAVQLDVEESVQQNVSIWFAALLSGQQPTAADLEPISAFARRRVHQGVTLQSLLQAFRTGSRVLWDVLLERAEDDRNIHRELLFKVSPYILLHFDLLGQAVGQAYSAEQQKRSRWRDRLRAIHRRSDPHQTVRSPSQGS